MNSVRFPNGVVDAPPGILRDIAAAEAALAAARANLDAWMVEYQHRANLAWWQAGEKTGWFRDMAWKERSRLAAVEAAIALEMSPAEMAALGLEVPPALLKVDFTRSPEVQL